MGIYLPNMEMPKDGELLCINIYPDGKVCINLDLDCKQVASAVPVPPHDKLIDADEFLAEINNICDRRDAGIISDLTCLRQIISALRHAPIIIPASEDTKTEKDTEPWLCLSCRNYPPSSTDGKPCSQCNPSEVLHSCYDPAEEGET